MIIETGNTSARYSQTLSHVKFQTTLNVNWQRKKFALCLETLSMFGSGGSKNKRTKVFRTLPHPHAAQAMRPEGIKIYISAEKY